MIYRKSAGFIYPSLNFQNWSIENRWIYLYLTMISLSSLSAQEEEEGSDEEHPKQRSPRQQPLWLKPSMCVSLEELQCPPSLEMSESPLVSPLEEVKVLHPQIITMATLHEASRYTVWECAFLCARHHNQKKPQKNPDLLSHVLKIDKDGSHLFVFFDQLVFSCGLFI